MNASNTQRVGFLGGTFDPLHLGHLWIAQDALESLSLDSVYFLPVPQSPLGKDKPVASFNDRFSMLAAALANHSRFKVADWERDLDPPYYTIHTVRMIKERIPDVDHFWIIGSDQASLLHEWYAIEALAEEIEFIVVGRPGHGETDDTVKSLRIHSVSGHTCSLSSTDIRNRLKEGLPVDIFLPDGVYCYIRQHELYT